MPPESDYRYDSFRLSHMLADMRFAKGTPGPGDTLPNLDLQTLDQDRIAFDTLDRPHLFVFGSNTCPMTASAGEVLNELHRQFGERIRFVLVQVREAHPGEHIPQPSSYQEKAEHARRLRDSLGLSFPVAVDDIEGSFHSSLDPKPNAAYLVDEQGIIQFRSIWSRDDKGLRPALAAAADGVRPERGQSVRRLVPSLAAIGHIDRVIRAAGPRARRDLLRSAPPMLLGARLAALFKGISPDKRGHALMATAGAVASAIAVVLLVL